MVSSVNLSTITSVSVSASISVSSSIPTRGRCQRRRRIYRRRRVIRRRRRRCPRRPRSSSRGRSFRSGPSTPLDQDADGASDADDTKNQFYENENDAGVGQRRHRQRRARFGESGRRVPAASGRIFVADLFRRQEVHERRRGSGDDEGERQRPLDVTEDAHDADENVKEADPNSKEKATAHEYRLENMKEHEKDAADNVGGADDAEQLRFDRLVRRGERRRVGNRGIISVVRGI